MSGFTTDLLTGLAVYLAAGGLGATWTTSGAGILEVQQSAPASANSGGVTQGGKSLSADDCTPSTTFIYALCDPDGSVRYVGKSDDPQERADVHWRHASGASHKDCWLRKLKTAGGRPTLRILEECAHEAWQDRERFWIAYYRSAGARLTNVTDGGEGQSAGYVPSEEARAKTRASVKASWSDPELRAKQGEDSKRRWDDPSYREGLLASRRAMWDDPENRENASVASKKRWADPAMRERHKASLAAAMADPDYGAKMSLAKKSEWANPEFREKMVAAQKAAWVRRKAREAVAS